MVPGFHELAIASCQDQRHAGQDEEGRWRSENPPEFQNQQRGVVWCSIYNISTYN